MTSIKTSKLRLLLAEAQKTLAQFEASPTAAIFDDVESSIRAANCTACEIRRELRGVEAPQTGCSATPSACPS